MVARDGDDRSAERDEVPVGALVLAAPAAVGQVARSDDEIGLHLPGEAPERFLDPRILACTRVEVGNMQDACGHERMRL